MHKKSSVAIFLAATSAIAISTADNSSVKAEDNLGGLKEWNTDMPIEADFMLDENAKRLDEEAKKSNMCIPIGEGENCW